MSASGPLASPHSASSQPLLDLRPGPRTAVLVAGSSVALTATVFAAIMIVANVTQQEVLVMVGSAAVGVSSATNWVVLPIVALLVGIWAVERSNLALRGLEPWTSMSSAAYCFFAIACIITGAIFDPGTAGNVTVNVLITLGASAVACRLLYSWSGTKEQRRTSAGAVRDESNRATNGLSLRVVEPTGARRRFVILLLGLSLTVGLFGPAIWLWTHGALISENAPFFLTLALLVFLSSSSSLWGSFVSATGYFASTGSKAHKVRRWLWVFYYSLPALIISIIIGSTSSVRSLALPFAVAWFVAVLAAHTVGPRSSVVGAHTPTRWRWLPGQALVDAVYERARLREASATAELDRLVD